MCIYWKIITFLFIISLSHYFPSCFIPYIYDGCFCTASSLQQNREVLLTLMVKLKLLNLVFILYFCGVIVMEWKNASVNLGLPATLVKNKI